MGDLQKGQSAADDADDASASGISAGLDDNEEDEEEGSGEGDDEKGDDTEAEDGDDEGSDDDEDDEEGDDDDDEDADGEDDDDEDDLEEILQLDPKVRKALPKEVAKRYDQHVRGLAKRATQVAAQETAITEYQGLVAALGDRATVKDTLKKVLDRLVHHHGMTVADLVGLQAGTQGGSGDTAGTQLLQGNARDLVTHQGKQVPRYEAAGFDSAGEFLLAQQNQQLGARLDAIEAERKQLAQERQQAAQQAEQRRQVSAAAPRIIKKIAKLENGFKVDRKMILQAAATFPDLFKTNPVQAVKAAFVDELKKHHRGQASTGAGKRRGPEMARTNQRRPRQTVQDLDELDARTLNRLLDEEE